MDDHGLDLSRPDVTRPEELAAFRGFYERTVGYALPAFEPWMEFRPDVLKRYRLQVRATPSDENVDFPLIRTLCSLHYYTVAAYEDGIAYELRNAQAQGATRGDLLETFALAFMDAGPRGMRYVATGALSLLRAYDDPPEPRADRWPPGWSCDPAALRSGLDFSVPDLLPGELDLLRAWYERVAGAVPARVEFLAAHRPALLKALRNRFEHVIVDSLPTQALPFLLVCLNVTRGSVSGIHEAALLARGLGVTAEQVMDAVAWGLMFGGSDGLEAAATAIGDLLGAREPS